MKTFSRSLALLCLLLPCALWAQTPTASNPLNASCTVGVSGDLQYTGETPNTFWRCLGSMGNGAGTYQKYGKINPFVALPVTGSVSAAASNTTLLQYALNQGGQVHFGCNGVAYIASTLYIHSNTHLTVDQNCVTTGIAGTYSLLANWASSPANVPWYVSQINNSGTSGPFSIIWSGNTPAWVTGTAYTQSASNNSYVTSNGNIYWLGTSSCTSGATAPSGTGTVSDGACSWTYVTTNQPNASSSGASGFMTATVYSPNHGLSVGNAAFLTPQPDSPTTSGYWSGTQSGRVAGGLADSAYFGVFYVSAINDSNWFTITLRRMPAVPFSGIPMLVKQADQNIVVDGNATWNYNYPTNQGISASLYNVTSMLSVFAGVENLRIDGLNGQQSQKYIVELNGVANAELRNINGATPGTNSDRIKVYGPAFDTHIDDSYSSGGDDVLSYQTEDAVGYNEYTLAVGDILGAHASNIVDDSGVSIHIYANQPYLLTDDVTLENMNMRDTLYNLYNPIGIANGAAVAATIGKVVIKNGSQIANNQCYVRIASPPSGGTLTINELDLDGIESNWAQPSVSGTTGCILSSGNYITINQVDASHIKSKLAGSGDYGFLFGGTSAVVNNFHLHDSDIEGAASLYGYAVWTEGSQSVVHGDISQNYFYKVKNVGNIQNTVANSWTAEGNTVADSAANGMSLFSSSCTGCIFRIKSNVASYLTLGLIRVNNTYTSTAFSDGMNQMLNGSLEYTQAGTGAGTLFGFVDIAQTATPTVNSCGSGSSLTTNSNAYAGGLNVPASTTSCSYNFPSNAYATNPRNCIAAVASTTAVAVGCTVTWTSATSGYFTVAGASIGGTAISYEINP